jgi:hypothetical protein
LSAISALDSPRAISVKTSSSGGGVLEQESTGAGAQRVIDVFVHVVGCQHQHARPAGRTGGDDLACRFESVHAWHPDVHQHDVRSASSRGLDRVDTVFGLAENAEVGLGVEDHPEPGAHERLVVGDQD